LLASAQLDLPALREGLLAWWAIHGRHSIPWKLGADQQPVACGEGLDPYPIWVAELHENQQRLAASASTPGQIALAATITGCSVVLHRCCHQRPSNSNRAGDAMTAQLSDGMGGAFAMLPLEPDGPLLAALRDGELYSRDLAVLWALVARLDWHSGRAWVSRQDLAQAIGHDRTKTVNGSLARIRRLGMAARSSDKRNRQPFWCVNPPVVAATGGPHRRKMQLDQFTAALV
jgi:hypothetical protein